MTPIEPTECKTTGRLLTEWFEFPEYSEEQLREESLKRLGLTERPPVDLIHNPDHPLADLARKVDAFVIARKRTKWKHNMSQQEVQARMNEATKMIDPSNYKFLPDSTRERTGLEMNPLWMLECLIRSGVLSPKEQVQALTQLAAYTHSKAASISHTTNTELTAEDWLMTLAKEEYKVIDEVKPDFQPKQRVEQGAGKEYQTNMKRKIGNTVAVQEIQDAQYEELSALFEED